MLVVCFHTRSQCYVLHGYLCMPACMRVRACQGACLPVCLRACVPAGAGGQASSCVCMRPSASRACVRVHTHVHGRAYVRTYVRLCAGVCVRGYACVLVRARVLLSGCSPVFFYLAGHRFLRPSPPGVSRSQFAELRIDLGNLTGEQQFAISCNENYASCCSWRFCL